MITPHATRLAPHRPPRRFSISAAVFPALLLAILWLAFATLASGLGFYWDDWMLAYTIHFVGPGGFPAAYAADRPLLAYLYTATSALLGDTPLVWQYFALAMRWLAAVTLAWVLRQTWPRRPLETAAVVLLFALYPGFRQQNIAITYGNALLLYVIFFASFGLTLAAIRAGERHPERFWLLYLASLLLGGLSLFLSEYFFGLELLRLALIWIVLGERRPQPRPRLLRTLRLSAPFLALMAAFLLWRSLTPTQRGQITLPGELAAAPLPALLRLLQTVAADLGRVTAQAWAQVFDFAALAEYDPAVWLKTALICATVAGLSAAGLWRLDRSSPSDPEPRSRWPRTALALSIPALLLAGIPFWGAGLQMMLSFPRDRFTAGMMLGAALLLVGLLALLAPRRWVLILLVSVAAGLAAGSHYTTALAFRKEWLAQRDFFWQLTWRAPGLKPGTVLMVTETPFPYDADHSLTAPLNWIYAPGNTTRSFPYLYYNIESHLSRGKPPLAEDLPIRLVQRLVSYDGSLADALLVLYQPGACLKVIDPTSDASLPEKPRFFREALPLSDPGVIDPAPAAPAVPPAAIFGAEPEHGWCYNYQKAALALQTGDDQAAAAFADAALADPPRLYRRNVAEMVPFIQAYVRTAQWDKAVEHTLSAYRAWENSAGLLCAAWQPARSTPAYAQVQPRLNCK